MVYNNIVNEDFLAGCKPQNVIPGYASFDEMAFHVLEATEADYNSMMMSVGVMELAHLEESGTEVVYEGVGSKAKELVDKAVALFKSMWEKVQGLIQSALKTFDKKAQEFREKVMNKLDKKVLEARAKGLKADAKFGSSFDYDDIADYSATVVSRIRKGDGEVEKLYKAAADKAADGDTTLVNGLTDELSKVTKGIIKSIAPNAEQASSIVKMMKDDIRGSRTDITGAWVKSHYSEIIKEVTDYPETKKNLKKDYNELKKGFNDAIKACKKANTDKMFNANAYTKAIRAYKDLRQITVYAQQAIISCLNERQNFYRSVIIKLVAHKPVKDDKKVVGESTTFDGISSLFNW